MDTVRDLHDVDGMTLLAGLEDDIVKTLHYSAKGWAKIPKHWKKFPLCWLGWGERSQCVREDSPWWNDEDLRKAVQNLLWDFHRTVADVIEKEFGLQNTEGRLRVIAEPSIDDSSGIFIITEDTKQVLYSTEWKVYAWDYATPEVMAEGLHEVYEQVKDKLRGQLVTQVADWIDTEVIAGLVVDALDEQGTPLTNENCHQQWLRQVEFLAANS